jgi:hypothetical protein
MAEVGRGAVLDMVTALNGMRDGRSLFAAGAPVGPVTDAEALLAVISGIAAGAPDLAAYEAEMAAFFSPGGRFETAHRAPGGPGPVTFPTGDGGSIGYAASEADPGLRGALEVAALVAGLGAAGFDVPPEGAAPGLAARALGAMDGLARAAGAIGAVEARVDGAATALEVSRAQTEQELSDLVGVDATERAAALRDEMGRLELLYAITARRADLRLTNVLR